MYTGTLIKINGVTLPCIKSYKVGRAKLWKDADRNMNGDVRATLIGIFPKILLQIGYTTEAQMAQLTALLDLATFEVEYFDVRVLKTFKATYYAADYEVELYSKKRGLYKPFSVNLVPISKRGY